MGLSVKCGGTGTVGILVMLGTAAVGAALGMTDTVG